VEVWRGMKASDLFVECLKREGVEVVFGIPGVESLDLVQSLSQSGIRLVATRTESGAAYMANVYGRLTGRAGVCLAGSGAAATHFATPLAGATMDHAPVVAISGQRNLARIQREPYQAIDIVSTLQPVTKWSTQIGRPELVPESVHKAFKISQTEPPGACHVALPEDVARQESSGHPFSPASLRRPACPDRMLDGAAELIDQAQKVVILAGHGAVRANATAELAEFVEEVGLWVISTPNAKGILPFQHPNFAYTIDIHCEEEALTLLREAEVVVAVGYELNEFPPDLWNPEGRAKVIHMSASPPQINRNYEVAVELVGDIRDSLRNMRTMKMIRRRKKLGNRNAYKEKVSRTLAQYENDASFPLKPQRVLADLARVVQPEDLLVCDMGTYRFWVSQLFPAAGAGSVMFSQSHNATGFALPGAVGAYLARPAGRVLALCGDGGFLASCAELATVCELELPLVALIFNDRQLSYIRALQIARFANPVATAPRNPDFVALARSFGAEALALGQQDDLEEVLRRTLEAGKPAVLDVPIDARENERIFDHWLRVE